MGKREENLALLKEWGLGVEEPPPEVPVQTNEPSTEEASIDSADQTSESEPPQEAKSPDGHDWDKRKRDAQDAQKALSRTQRELDQKKREIDAKLAELDLKLEKLSRLSADKTASDDLVPSQEDSEFSREYPDLAREVAVTAEAKARQALREEREREEAERKSKELEERATQLKADQIIADVLDAVPDAKEVASSESFQQWLDNLPSRMSKEYRDYIERTTLYSAQDAIDVLEAYKATSPKATKPKPVVDEQIPPSGSTNNGPSSKGIRALTAQEMDRIDSLVQNSRTPEERKLWSDRLRFTFSQS